MQFGYVHSPYRLSRGGGGGGGGCRGCNYFIAPGRDQEYLEHCRLSYLWTIHSHSLATKDNYYIDNAID